MNGYFQKLAAVIVNIIILVKEKGTSMWLERGIKSQLPSIQEVQVRFPTGLFSDL